MSIFRKAKFDEFIIIAVQSGLNMTPENNSVMVALIEQHKPNYWEIDSPYGYLIGFRSKLKSSQSRAEHLIRSIGDLINTKPEFKTFSVGQSEGKVVVEFDWKGRVTFPPLGEVVNKAKKNAEHACTRDA
jgi:hypothetical protein